MPNPELVRIVDGIARDKNIEREQVYVRHRAGSRVGIAEAFQHGRGR